MSFFSILGFGLVVTFGIMLVFYSVAASLFMSKFGEATRWLLVPFVLGILVVYFAFDFAPVSLHITPK